MLTCTVHIKAVFCGFSTFSGPGKTIALATGVATVGIGGALAYAKFDSDFRHKLESSLPYGDSLIGNILGPAEAPM